MLLKLMILILITALAVTGCKSPSEKTVEEVKKVDSSLIESNNDLTAHSVESVYSFINRNRKSNEAIALKADSLMQLYKSAYTYMEGLKENLQLPDSSLESVIVPTRLLAGTATGDTLGKKLLQLSDYTYTVLVNSQKKESLDSVFFSSISGMRENKQWTKRYFEKTPTMGALTILAKFENDCTGTAQITLEDLKQHLAE
jgi:GldM N-terminal domain